MAEHEEGAGLGPLGQSGKEAREVRRQRYLRFLGKYLRFLDYEGIGVRGRVKSGGSSSGLRRHLWISATFGFVFWLTTSSGSRRHRGGTFFSSDVAFWSTTASEDFCEAFKEISGRGGGRSSCETKFRGPRPPGSAEAQVDWCIHPSSL